MHEREFTKDELELVDLLNRREITRAQATSLGYRITDVFLLKCHFHGIPIYESDDNNVNKTYGILRR